MLDRFWNCDSQNNYDVDTRNPIAFHYGDLIGIAQRFNYIQPLRPTTIWLTPRILINSKSNSDRIWCIWGYQGYWVDEFGVIDKRFGTETERKDFRQYIFNARIGLAKRIDLQSIEIETIFSDKGILH